MKPEQFIREHGEKKAREVVEDAPDGHKGYNDVINQYTRGVWFSRDVMLSDLKRLVESLEIIETVGYDRDGAEEIYEFSKDCEVIHYAGLEIKVTRLAQAIRDHESIYGGGDA
ncbi:hypothetical protein DKE47_006250 [Acinetobacter nosocomialis]|nr:hypothetical protein DKE47_006250 [Acinetobacter nosocomialis]